MQQTVATKKLTLDFVYPYELASWEGVSANLKLRDMSSNEDPTSVIVWGTNQLPKALKTLAFDVPDTQDITRYALTLEVMLNDTPLFHCLDYKFLVPWDELAEDELSYAQQTIYLDAPGLLVVTGLAGDFFGHPADAIRTLNLIEISDSGVPGMIISSNEFPFQTPPPLHFRYEADKVKSGQRYRIEGWVNNRNHRVSSVRGTFFLKSAPLDIAFGADSGASLRAGA